MELTRFIDKLTDAGIRHVVSVSSSTFKHRVTVFDSIDYTFGTNGLDKVEPRAIKDKAA